MLKLFLLVMQTLIDFGASEYLLPSEVEDTSLDIAHICAYESEVDSVLCAKVIVILWSLETNTWSLTPRSRGNGCGPLQVLPVEPKRLGGFGTLPCVELEVPVVGFRWGWRIWKMKAELFDWNLKQSFRWYNGHPKYRDFYARRAMKLWRVLEQR